MLEYGNDELAPVNAYKMSMGVIELSVDLLQIAHLLNYS